TSTLSGGVAVFSTATLASGTHSITAVYSGDATNSGSTSAALIQTVKSNTITTVVTSSNPALAGSSITFTASVSPATATGTARFLEGATVLGTSTLAGGTAALSTSALT